MTNTRKTADQVASGYPKPRCPGCGEVLVPDPNPMFYYILVHKGYTGGDVLVYRVCSKGKRFVPAAEARYDSLADLVDSLSGVAEP